MIRYIPSSAAVPLSVALWSLARPPELREDNDTQYLFPWVTATDESLWLSVETEFQITVHPAASLGGIAAILQPWIDAGQLPADTNTQLAALIESKLGQCLVVYDAFPDLFKAMSKTHAEMIAAGLLAEPEMP